MNEYRETDQMTGESSRGRKRRPWLRWVAVIFVAALAAQCVWTALWFRDRLHNKMRAHGCYDNLREIGVVFQMWKHESDERWPKLSDVPGEFMFDPNQATKDGSTLIGFFSKPSVLRCPRVLNISPDDEFPGDANYIYLGPGLQTEVEALAFLDSYLQAARAGEPLPMPVYDPPADPTERAHAEQSMPLLFDRPQNHNRETINVIRADGSFECLTMGTRYPATQAFWDKLEAVEAELEKR